MLPSTLAAFNFDFINGTNIECFFFQFFLVTIALKSGRIGETAI
jgi:hypothetical protein